MRFHLRERAWSLTEAFLVRDDAGNPVFEIRGKFFHIGDNLLMYDRYSGQEVAQIKQRMLSLLPRYEIYRNGEHGPAFTSNCASSASASRSRATTAWRSMFRATSGAGTLP